MRGHDAATRGAWWRIRPALLAPLIGALVPVLVVALANLGFGSRIDEVRLGSLLVAVVAVVAVVLGFWAGVAAAVTGAAAYFLALPPAWDIAFDDPIQLWSEAFFLAAVSVVLWLLRRSTNAREAADLAARRNHLVGQVSATLNEALSVDEVASRLAAVAVGALADRVVVARPEEDGSQRLLAVAGYPDEHAVDMVGIALPPGIEAPIFDAARTGTTVVVGSEDDFAVRYPSLRRERAELGHVAVAAVPVLQPGTGTTAVVLNLAWTAPTAFVGPERAFLDTVATVVAGALGRIAAVERANDDTFRQALDAMLDAVTIARSVHDAEGDIVDFVLTHANRAYVVGNRSASAAERVNRRLTELHPEVAASGVLEQLVRVVETGEPLVLDDVATVRELPDGGTAPGFLRLQVVPFGDGYLATTRDITEDIAMREAVVAAEVASQRERAAVDMLQRIALPELLPSVGGVEVDAVYLPATTESPVGGDWYDAVTTDDGRLVLIVGDVAGHGRDSAVQMVQARSILHTLVQGQPLLTDVLLEVNRLLNRLWAGETFATCVLAAIDLSADSLEVASAGHPPPLTRSDGPWSYVPVRSGPPLGVLRQVAFPTHRVPFGPGSGLVLFTDGLVESRVRPIGDGMVELAALLEAGSGGSGAGSGLPDAGAVRRLVVEGLVAGERSDDVCVLTARRT